MHTYLLYRAYLIYPYYVFHLIKDQKFKLIYIVKGPHTNYYYCFILPLLLIRFVQFNTMIAPYTPLSGKR